MKSPVKYKLVNAGLFQIGWFSCVLLPTTAAVTVTAAILAVHFYNITNPQSELLFISVAGISGYFMDFMYSLTGLIDLNAGNFSQVYLVCVWLLFTMTLRWSMDFLTSYPLPALITGLLAPLSYFAAQQFGKINYSEPLLKSMSFHALLWSLYMLIVHKVKFSQNSQCVNER